MLGAKIETYVFHAKRLYEVSIYWIQNSVPRSNLVDGRLLLFRLVLAFGCHGCFSASVRPEVEWSWERWGVEG